jgi:hypothetical protein
MAQGEQLMKALTEVKQAFKEFNEAQSNFSNFGAYDTEPDWQFQNIIRNAVTKGKGVLPRSVRGWELYYDMEGAGKAVKGLNKAAKKARDLVLKHWGNIEVRKFVMDECWRVDF